MARRAILAGIAGGGIAAGFLSLRAGRVAPDFSYSRDSISGTVALLEAGWALITCGLALSVRRHGSRFGPLLASAGFAWFVLQWNNPRIGSALAFTIGLCLSAACPAVVAHAVLAYPGSRIRSHGERLVVAVGYVTTVLMVGLLPAMLFDPKSQGCGECSGNLVLVADRPHAVHELRRLGLALAAGWAVAATLLALGRVVRASAAARRARWPVATPGAAHLVLAAALFAASVDRGFLWNGTLERQLWLGQAGALSALALAAGASVARARRTRAAVARLVVDLEGSPQAGGLKAMLAAILGDPSVVLAYPLEGSERLVDATGRAVDLGGCQERTTLRHAGSVAAVLGHAPGALDDAQLVEDVTAAARLVLENERLQAAVQAQLEDLRSSRARIVEAGDAERKRLERDLHDGAQQRLVALSLSLRLLRSRLQASADGEFSARLQRAEAELDGAVAELRELAHGIFPAVLADAGLDVAVRALAEEGRVPIRVGELPAHRFPAPIENAAYTVVAEAARSATAGLSVNGAYHGGTLVIEVAIRGGITLNVAVLEDRLGALDGRFEIQRPHEGDVRLRAELPCAS